MLLSPEDNGRASLLQSPGNSGRNEGPQKKVGYYIFGSLEIWDIDEDLAIQYLTQILLISSVELFRIFMLRNFLLLKTMSCDWI